MYSIITATERVEFTDYGDLCKFIGKSTYDHFIVEFSEDTHKGEGRLYYPQDIYDRDNDPPGCNNDVESVEWTLIDRFEKNHKREEIPIPSSKLYSLITRNERFEFDDIGPLYHFVEENTYEHFIVEFSEETNKGFSKLYYPQNIYTDDKLGWCCDRGLVEDYLYVIFMERSGRGDELEC